MTEMIITLVIGTVSITVTFFFSLLAKRNQARTQKLIASITGLFSASQKVGIVTAYENREIALAETDTTDSTSRAFVSRIEREKKLIVVGSSLLGFKLYIPHLTELLTARNRREQRTDHGASLRTHSCQEDLM